jgi:hypothetical protein
MKLYPSSLSEMYIEWSVAGEQFAIFRSTSPENGFELIAENIDQPFFVDYNVNLYDENIRYYYEVKGFTAGVEVSKDGPVTLEYNQKDAIANKVIHESNVTLRAMQNPPVFFLIKRRVGEPCDECWNPITKKVRYANCAVCNGTGIIEGYHLPIVSRISQDVSQLVMFSSEQDDDKVKLTPIRAWIGNKPLLYPEDVMVDIMNQRYKITNVSRRTKSQYVIRQVIDLTPLEKGHPAYQVDVDRRVKP